MNEEQENPCFTFASTRWYDWQGTLTEEKLISRWKGVELLPAIFSSAELDQVIEPGVGELCQDKSFLLELWKDSLVSEDKIIIVNHVDKLVYDYEGIHELDGWSADILTRELDQKLRDKLPKLLKLIRETQEKFDQFKEEYKDNFEKALWQLYVQTHPDEASWFPMIVKCKDDSTT